MIKAVKSMDAKWKNGVLQEGELYELLGAVIRQLPGKQRLILFEYYYNDMKISEIAKIYEMSETNVRCMLAGGRKGLEETILDYLKRKRRCFCIVSAESLIPMIFQEEIEHTEKSAEMPERIVEILENEKSTKRESLANNSNEEKSLLL